MTTHTLHFLLLLFLASFVSTGCNKQQRLAPVHGTVYFRKEPLRGGTIVFAPDADKGGRGPMARAEIKPDGTYTLSTGPDGGCVPGWHRVSIRGTDRATQGTPLALPPRFCDPELSGLSREVKPGEDNAIDFNLN